MQQAVNVSAEETTIKTSVRDDYIKLGRLHIAEPLFNLVNDEIVPGTGVEPGDFWSALENIVVDLGPRNRELLKIRDGLQAKIDAWHREHRSLPHEPDAYKTFLEEIGYLVDEGEDFKIDPQNIDAEIAEVAGPQLVVPLDNARYVLNAVNARWRSLYDALYSTDVVPEVDGCGRIKKYNPIRGDKVIAVARQFLDRHFPFERESHRHVTQYCIENGEVVGKMGDGTESTLLKPQQFIGYTGDPADPDAILLIHHTLHVEIRLGEGYFIGRKDHAKIYDIHMEAAVTSIMDCEDSVASVDTEDKVAVYRNWLGLMKGTLVRTILKDDKTIERAMEPDRIYIDPHGDPLVMHGRSLMLVRNAGSHLETDAVLFDGRSIPETMLDAMVTTLCAKHDLFGNGVHRNSLKGSIYIVKPKMHGPDEVAHADELFSRVEDALGLQRNTLKIGIMDEERRTSVNLKACIRAVRDRLAFINTGFLDRTGDDIHTNMEAGPMIPKGELKKAKWLQAYEASNVQIGLNCGLKERAHIGKGMWAMPDEMHAMMETKIQHLKAGANTSWVPSPVAATLHAFHYHRLNVKTRQDALMKAKKVPVEDILDIPLLARELSKVEIRRELENNAQGILGYVSRWVGQGVGCSKVPDINGIALMEDCATLRISSQHIANWLHHGILTEEEVLAAMKRMAVIVDRQNRGDPNYQPMAEDFNSSIPFQAALDLVFKGRGQPNGYTEFILYERRRQLKAAQQ